MRSIFYLLDVAPYGSERAYGLLNAAAVSIKMNVSIGLYGDGVYLALADQDSRNLGVPCLTDLLFAYPEVSILAHEPSLVERELLNQSLIERVELVDEDVFIDKIRAADCIITL
ncbi:MAG: DsrE family protein [Methanotrichaceae archaeon]|nr:DsrE family protein [Methanotrichaceae archaeon]